MRLIYPPTFTSKQQIDAPKSEPNPDAGDLSHTGSKRFIQRLVLGSLILTRTALQTELTSPLNTDSIPIDEMADELFSLRRPPSFFRKTSRSMTLSRLKSATSCLSLRFSSSSGWRRRLGFGTPSPQTSSFRHKTWFARYSPCGRPLQPRPPHPLGAVQKRSALP